MSIFFTSDLHLSHENIIKYAKRPFQNVQEMNETIIKNWNNKINHDDLVYVLGDFTLSKDKIQIKRLFHSLKGRKILIKGNHDKTPTLQMPWEGIYDIYKLNHQQHTIILCHYALRVWEKSHFNSWHLYGHSHGRLPGIGKSLDIGVDCWDYSPISFEELEKEMSNRSDNLNLIKKSV